MATNTMNYLDTYRTPGNYLLMGDFNLYSDEEPAYVRFLYYDNSSWRFNDPIDQSGSWSSNKYYKDVHTQSTHSTSSGCAASGGMDDRFDFVLVSDDILKGNKSVRYIPETYTALGQDGKHFNSSIISSPTNSSVPNDVLYALYYNSDHLPVSMKILVDKTLAVSELRHNEFQDITITNPVWDQLNLTIQSKKETGVKLEIINASGQSVFTEERELKQGPNSISINLSSLKSGFYLIRFTDSNGNMVVRKMLRN